MTTHCYTCAEIRAGQNKRARKMLQLQKFVGRKRLAVQELRAEYECRLCRRGMCGLHRHFDWAGRVHGNYCRECFALHSRFGGRKTGFGTAREMSFRRRWHLFRWRVTMRRLVERGKIGRVVVEVLPKDLALIVATYAVK